MAIKKPEAPAPYMPYDWENNLDLVYALKALKEGTATADQQGLIVSGLIKLTGYHDLSYRPDSDRDTAFAEGKRFIGAQLIKLMTLDGRVIQESINRRAKK